MTFGYKVGYIWARWRPYRSLLALLSLFTLVSSGVAVAYPLVLKFVIDGVERALRAGVPPELGKLLFVLLLTLLGRFVASFYPACRAWMNLKIENDIRSEAFARVLEKDYRFQRAFRTGDVVTRLTDDVADFPKIAWFCCSGIFRAFDSGAKVVLSLAALFILDARLAALSIAPLPLVVLLFYVVGRRLTAYFAKQQAAISRTNDLLEATFSGVRIVKAFSAEAGSGRKLGEILDDRIGIQLGVVRLFSLFRTLGSLATVAGQVVALAAGGLLVARGELALGTLYAFYVYLDMIVQPLPDLSQLLVGAEQAFVSVGRIEELRRYPAPSGGAHGPPAGAPLGPLEEISLRGIGFRYEGATADALGEVEIGVRRGERLAIVGAVGSGKTTLLKVLVGLLPPARGELRVNGRALEEVSLRAFRGRLGYVPQEALLFSESIRENVALGRAAAGGVAGAAPKGEAGETGEGRRAVDRALAIAQLDEDLARLERGADTILGDKGGLISGGQKQRVAIARALARRPDLLVLDDATAALDARAEERFWEDLDAEFPDLATIVTTHRLATVRRADRVVLLDRGRSVAAGTHEDLLARSPEYRHLLATEARAGSAPAAAR